MHPLPKRSPETPAFRPGSALIALKGEVSNQKQIFDEGQHGGDARLQVGKDLLLVFQLGHFHAGQPGRHAFSKISCHLGLAQQRIGFDLFRGGMGLGFAQDLPAMHQQAPGH